jgi:hypothetical protein
MKEIHQINREIDAWNWGRDAYRQGKDCIASDDAGFRLLAAPLSATDAVRLFDQWQRGWIFECLNYRS